MDNSKRRSIKNRDIQIHNNQVSIVKEFPTRDNFSKNNYRKDWVATIFVDIKGYTEICKNRDDKYVGKMIRTFHEGVLEIMKEYKLKHIDIQGDGIFGVLHVPKKNNNNSQQIFNCALDINGFLLNAWNLEDYKIGISLREELMVIVGSGEEKEIVFAGGSVNTAKKILENESKFNAIIMDKCFVENNHDILRRGEHDYIDGRTSNGNYYSNWIYTEWEK